MIQALIFDFDGVIVLSEEARFKVIQKMAAKRSVSIPDTSITLMVGRTTKNFLGDVIPTISEEIKQQIISDYESEYKGNILNHVQPVGFIVEYIKTYTGELPLALASMSDISTIETVTKYFGIYDKFTVILSKGDVTHHKPDPEIYLKAAKQLSITPKECLVFEDTLVGAQAALRAHMQCVGVLNGFNSEKGFLNEKIAGCVSQKGELESIIRHG